MRRMSEEEMKVNMNNMTDEQRSESMQMGLFWVCSVMDECKMNSNEVNIQSLLDVMFDLVSHQLGE